MDEHTDVLEVRHEQRSDQTVRSVARSGLRRIDAKAWPPERVQWLWEQTLKEDYATDDIGAATPELFISNLFLGNTEHWEFNDDAYIAILNILNRVNADVHFAVWGDVALPTIIECHNVLVDRLFEAYALNRITAYVPAFNKKMTRFCTVLGYKYEGEIREIFLKDGKYHNMFVYGLLRKDYERRRKV